MRQNRGQLAKLLDHQWQNIEPQYTANTNGHDAAVVLASPGFAKLLADKAFLEDLAVLLSRSENGGESAVTQFHLVAAVVDRIHQIALSNRVDEGISILRSHRDILLPKLWDSVAPKERQDADTVSALTFALPESATLTQSSVTMPLARTLFQNGKPSTLIASSFDLSGPSPKLLQTAESHTHTVNLPSRSFDYWAPLLPLTHAREVTQSFGNIVRGIQVDGETLPASTELEDAIINNLAGVDLGLPSGEPVSVFAVVTPPVSESVSSKKAPEPALDFEKGASIRDDPVIDQIHDTAEYVQQVLESGGKLFKVCKCSPCSFDQRSSETNAFIVSGGGGWGAKKGLLSLDPQTSHFSRPESEELDSLFSADGDDGFAPAGSRIQFFAASPAPPPGDHSDEISVLGVSGDCSSFVGEDPEFGRSVCGGFGATSDQSVFVNFKTDTAEGASEETLKLSVPGSHIMLPVRM